MIHSAPEHKFLHKLQTLLKYVSFWFVDKKISMLSKEMTLVLRLFLKTVVPRGSVNNASLAAYISS